MAVDARAQGPAVGLYGDHSVDRTTLRLLGLDILDDQGTVRKFRFSNLRENQGIPDSAFAFKVPPGVEVQQ